MPPPQHIPSWSSLALVVGLIVTAAVVAHALIGRAWGQGIEAPVPLDHIDIDGLTSQLGAVKSGGDVVVMEFEGGRVGAYRVIEVVGVEWEPSK